jgi:hypothetical protein
MEAGYRRQAKEEEETALLYGAAGVGEATKGGSNDERSWRCRQSHDLHVWP